MLFLYLYLGYFLVKLYSVIGVLSQEKIALSALFFSIVVFFIWSFIPVLAYLFAKLIGAKGRSSAKMLFVIGASAALLENALFYFMLSLFCDVCCVVLSFSLCLLFVRVQSKRKTVESISIMDARVICLLHLCFCIVLFTQFNYF